MRKSFNKIFMTILIFMFILSSLTYAKQYDGPAPTEFNQAPMLDNQVEEGSLPSVEERVPDNPYVVDPSERVGDYGGTIYSATPTNIEGWGEDTMLLMDWANSFIKANADGSELVPNFAEKMETSEDLSTFTIYLRKGVKWSDGEPFTADDIMFWYNDVLLNEELTPAVSSQYKSNNEVMKMEKLDEHIVQIKFSTPKPFFPNTLTLNTGWDFIYPKHYLKNYHPEYTDAEELEEKVNESGFDSWYELFLHQNSSIGQIPLIEDRPTLTAYKLVNKTSSRRVFERNPYFWKVDKEGNQLPYIDRIETELAADKEVLNGKIMSGEVDFAAWQLDIRNYPMYRKYEDEGGYRTLLWRSGFANEVIYTVNMTHEDSDMRDIFQNVKFRRALSLAIDREEINESIYFGRAEPRQYTVISSSRYFEPEFENAYTEYDPDRAEKLLDEIGLVDRNGNGWRDLPNGDNFTFTVEFTPRTTPKVPNVELVSEHWKNIGLDVKTKQISAELGSQRFPANMADATLSHGDKGTDIYFPQNPQFLVPVPAGWETTAWPKWANWFETDGEEGEEPPADIKELRNWWEEMLNEPDEEKRIELGKKILSSQAENLWNIGTIGKAPWPAVANKNLRNVHEDVIWVWDLTYYANRDPEQLFFEGGVNEK